MKRICHHCGFEVLPRDRQPDCEVVYHRVCFDISVASLTTELESWADSEEGKAFAAKKGFKIVCPACKGVPVRPDIPKCHGCMACDFTGTRDGYLKMQEMEEEAQSAAPE